MQDDKEKKRLELLERKKENQRLLDEENSKLRGKSQKEIGSGGKVTRSQIEETLQDERLQQEQQESQLKGMSNPSPLGGVYSNSPYYGTKIQIECFSNRKEPPGGSSGGECEQNFSRWRNCGGQNNRRCHRCAQVLIIYVCTVCDWFRVLQAYKTCTCLSVHHYCLRVSSTGPEDVDHHPERRMKAAFAAYEEANMPRLKMENPNMRLSQLKQQLKKEWMKAPENPLNQRFSAYNSKWMHCFGL